ncbi:MAG TPA: winged helix-turn-helix domain-containing protein [Stellaceae bacterium]|jgi:molybdate transport system regulatory protein|nr:winged helix-turn-helix domain-containing protein [Stellaceae bacterium]
MATLTLRLDFAPGQSIGHGKIRLLEAVREHGSISAAGRSMRMSYRRAWLLIDELNRMFAEPLIETKHGGTAGGGAELTAFGQRVVDRYRSIEANALAAGAKDLADLAAAVGRGRVRKTRRRPHTADAVTSVS